jgi:transposase
MPAERIAMRHVRDVLRLKAAGVTGNEIARRVGVASSTVRLTLKRLAAAELRWPLPAELTDAALEEQLFAAVGKKQGHRRLAEPDWTTIHRELKRKHVTLQILWDEYIEAQPDGYRYSRFCELYRAWAARLSVTMRQSHAGGDKLFVDYAGDTVSVIIDRLTGKTRPAQIFVAVLGASNFTHAEASWSQALADWIGAHTRAFAAIGGVPHLLVPDNTKSLPLRKRGSPSSRLASTSRRSTALTPRWRRITTRRSCRPGRAARVTRFHEDWLRRPARVEAGD